MKNNSDLFDDNTKPTKNSTQLPTETNKANLQKNDNNLGLKYLICGAVAGAVSRTCTAPLDRIKVHLQTQTSLSLKSFRGAFNCILAQTPSSHNDNSKNQSSFDNKKIKNNPLLSTVIRSFWRGNGLNCMKIIPEFAIRFCVFESIKIKLGLNDNQNNNKTTFLSQNEYAFRIFIAGGIAGFVSQLLVYPLETIKTRTMANSSCLHERNLGYFATAHKMLNLSAHNNFLIRIQPFFRGLSPSIVGIIPYAGIELGIYELLRPKNKNQTIEKSNGFEYYYYYCTEIMKMLLVGSVAAGTAAVTVYPLSLIRTRMQAQGTIGHPQLYKGFFDVAQRTWRKESIRGFYKGIAPTLLKVIPSAAINYLCYEQMKNLLNASD